MKTLVLTTLSVIALTGCMSSAKQAQKTAPTNEIPVNIKGDDYSTLIKSIYKDVKKQCLNEEPKIITQELLKDGKQIDIPINTTAEKPFHQLFAIINKPVLQMQSTPKANYEYKATLKCSGWHINFK